MDHCPEGGVFSLFAVSVDDHAEAVNGLPLFFEDRDDIDPAATAQAHEQHLHGADAKILTSGLGAAVHACGVSIGVFGFEAEISFNPAEFDPDHISNFFAKVRHLSPYFAFQMKNWTHELFPI